PRLGCSDGGTPISVSVDVKGGGACWSILQFQRSCFSSGRKSHEHGLRCASALTTWRGCWLEKAFKSCSWSRRFVEPPSAEGTETLRPNPLTSGIFFVTPRAGSLSVMEPWLQQLSDMLPDA